MMTVLMILDAIISIALILVILGQEAKSGGMGGMDGGSLLARITVILGVLFAIITLVIAKLSM